MTWPRRHSAWCFTFFNSIRSSVGLEARLDRWRVSKPTHRATNSWVTSSQRVSTAQSECISIHEVPIHELTTILGYVAVSCRALL